MIILNFESGTRFQDFQKYNHHFGLFSTPFYLYINFLLANFLIECSRTTIRYTDQNEILNIVFLLEFYNNYLARKKYKQILIHNITFCKYVGMYIYIYEKLFSSIKFTKSKIKSSL